MARVLVAEDDDNFRALVTATLSQGGHEVVEAKDGQEAWEKLQDNPADLLLLDLNMPRMDGLELCRRVRQSEAFRRTPILMLTVKAMVEERDPEHVCVLARKYPCFGACEFGINMAIHPDGLFYSEVGTADLTEIVENLFAEGKPIERLLGKVPKDIEEFIVQMLNTGY